MYCPDQPPGLKCTASQPEGSDMAGRNETLEILEECRRRYFVREGKLYYGERARRRGERGGPAGSEAGTWTGKGYLSVQIFRTRFYVHRIIWALEHGRWPAHEIDHRYGGITDNGNLREATTKQNRRNQALSAANTSGVTGVSLNLASLKWYAYITVDGKMIGLGLYSEKADAVAARHAAEDKYFGEWSARRSRSPA